MRHDVALEGHGAELEGGATVGASHGGGAYGRSTSSRSAASRPRNRPATRRRRSDASVTRRCVSPGPALAARVRAEERLDLDRRGGRRVDEERPLGKRGGDRRGEERVVRAAEDDDARPRLDDGRQVEAGGGARDLVLRPAFLGERDEERAGDVHHRPERIERADGAAVRVGRDGRLRGEDGDRRLGAGTGEAPRPAERRARARPDDADDGDVADLLDDDVEREGRGRVARHDDGLDAPREEERDGAACVAAHGLGRLRSVGEARRVAEVEEVLRWQAAGDGVEDGESADPGVEEADRAWSLMFASRHAVGAPRGADGDGGSGRGRRAETAQRRGERRCGRQEAGGRGGRLGGRSGSGGSGGSSAARESRARSDAGGPRGRRASRPPRPR